MLKTSYPSFVNPFKYQSGVKTDFACRALNVVPNIPRVSSLVFDMEIEDTLHAGVDEHANELAFKELRSILDRLSEPELKLAVCVRLAREHAAQRRRPLEILELAERLSGCGFEVKTCTALGGGMGGECLRNLRHSFLICSLPGGMSRTKYIVDPNFKEQFEIAAPTRRYGALLKVLPTEFVGTERKIVEVVQLLCHEISLAFKEQGKTLPPWRQAESMLSKWQPRRSVEQQLTPRSR